MQDFTFVIFFFSQGFGEDVPIYLQTDIKVRNREYTQGEALELIKEIWKAKTKQESEVIIWRLYTKYKKSGRD